MSNAQRLNLILRSLMEAGIVAGLGYYGFHIGESMGMKILFMIGLPLIGFGFWGMVDFHQFGKFSEMLRLIQELIISGLAAVALYFAGANALGWILGILSIVYHFMVYASGNKLLKR